MRDRAGQRNQAKVNEMPSKPENNPFEEQNRIDELIPKVLMSFRGEGKLLRRCHHGLRTRKGCEPKLKCDCVKYEANQMKQLEEVVKSRVSPSRLSENTNISNSTDAHVAGRPEEPFIVNSRLKNRQSSVRIRMRS
ncbi:hypothetical protein V3C99_016287 [Haemonchus contortus]